MLRGKPERCAVTKSIDRGVAYLPTSVSVNESRVIVLEVDQFTTIDISYKKPRSRVNIRRRWLYIERRASRSTRHHLAGASC